MNWGRVQPQPPDNSHPVFSLEKANQSDPAGNYKLTDIDVYNQGHRKFPGIVKIVLSIFFSITNLYYFVQHNAYLAIYFRTIFTLSKMKIWPVNVSSFVNYIDRLIDRC